MKTMTQKNITCPRCGESYPVGPEHAGTSFRCAVCGATVSVPAARAEAPAAADNTADQLRVLHKDLRDIRALLVALVIVVALPWILQILFRVVL